MPATNTSLSVIDMRNLTEMALNVINRTLSIMDNHELFRQTEQEGMKENVVLTGLFALFTAVIVVAVWILVKQRRTRRSNATVTVLIGTLLVLYVTTAVYWVIALWATMTNYTTLFVSSVQRIQSSLSDTVQCLESALDRPSLDHTSLNSTCVYIPSVLVVDSAYYNRSATRMCAGHVAAVINVTIGDAIVWWRALVIWQQNRVVCGIGMVLVLATFGMLTISTYTAFLVTVAQSNKSPLWKPDVLYSIGPGGYLGETFVASCLSLCTNIAATLLIAYKAWAHRKLVRSYLSTGSTRQLVEKVLLLLVESGALYCVLSAVVVFSLGMELGYWGTLAPLDEIASGLVPAAAIIPLVGIYPAAIIVICAFNKSLNDTQISLRVPSIEFEDTSGRSHSVSSEAWQVQNIDGSITPSRDPR